MGQLNHDDCWIPIKDLPRTSRRVIIWTKKPCWPLGDRVISRHLDVEGAWYDRDSKAWFHSDGSEAEGVTHWMEMPGKPK